MGKAMSAEAVEARKAYQREYRRRNRDKINSRRKNCVQRTGIRYSGIIGSIGSAGQERQGTSGHLMRTMASRPKGWTN